MKPLTTSQAAARLGLSLRDENAQLAGYVYLDAATRDIGGYVESARRAIDTQPKLPPGYTLQWTGQYEFQVKARERLKILIPIVFFSIFMLLYMTFHSASEASIVMLSVVYAMTGGVILQWLLGYNFSGAVWVGYITLAPWRSGNHALLVSRRVPTGWRSRYDSIIQEAAADGVSWPCPRPARSRRPGIGRR